MSTAPAEDPLPVRLTETALDHIEDRIAAIRAGDEAEARYHKRQHEQAIAGLKSLDGGDA